MYELLSLPPGLCWSLWGLLGERHLSQLPGAQPKSPTSPPLWKDILPWQEAERDIVFARSDPGHAKLQPNRSLDHILFPTQTTPFLHTSSSSSKPSTAAGTEERREEDLAEAEGTGGSALALCVSQLTPWLGGVPGVAVKETKADLST